MEAFLDVGDTEMEDLETLQDSPVPDDRKQEWLTSFIKPHSELYRIILESKLMTATLMKMEKQRQGYH